MFVHTIAPIINIARVALWFLERYVDLTHGKSRPFGRSPVPPEAVAPSESGSSRGSAIRIRVADHARRGQRHTNNRLSSM